MMVEVWSNSSKTWVPGTIEAVYEVDCVADGFAVPAGCVKVASASWVKYLMPNEVSANLRRPSSQHGSREHDRGGPGPPPTAGAAAPPTSGAAATSSASSLGRSRPSARTRCGKERLMARDRWNASELKIQELFNAYDRDGSRGLEPEELRELLQDFNGDGRPPTDREVSFIMGFCDTNQDGAIQLGELHYALRAWHSFRHLDEPLLDLFTAFDLDESGRLDVGELRELLTAMNGGHQVDLEEAQSVMDRAGVLSDSGGVNRSELLGAIAAWYAHVDRTGTDMHTLLREAVVRTALESPSASGAPAAGFGQVTAGLGGLGGYFQVADDAEAALPTGHAPLEGWQQPEQSRAASGTLPNPSKVAPVLVRTCSTFCHNAFLFIAGWALAALGWSFRESECPRNLDGALLWFGLLVIFMGVLAHLRGHDATLRALRAATAVALALLNVVGVRWSFQDEVETYMHSCGDTLVHLSRFTWVTIPVLALLYAAHQIAAHMKRLRSHDQRLQKEVLL